MRGEPRKYGTPSLAGDSDAQRTWQSQDNRFDKRGPVGRHLKKLQIFKHAALALAYAVFFRGSLLIRVSKDAVFIETGRFQTRFFHQKLRQDLEKRSKKRQKHPYKSPKARENGSLITQMIEPEYCEGGHR